MESSVPSSCPAINGAIKSSNLSLDSVMINSSLTLTPNFVRISPAPPYPSKVLTYASIEKLSSNFDVCTSSITVFVLTYFLGI